MNRSSTPKNVWSQVLALDERILLLCQRLHAPPLTKAMRALTHLGDAASWTFIALVLLCSGQPDPAYRLAGAALLATAASQVLKRWLKRSRPSTKPGFTALVENPDAFSFPSGHTAAAFAVGIALAASGTLLSPLMFAVACCVGASRVYLGAHYPLDVAAGGLLGMAAGLTVHLAMVA